MSKSHTHRCWVRAGNRGSLKRLIRWVGARWYYESIQAQEFCCVACGELWDLEDMTGDVKKQPPNLTAGEFNRSE